MSKVVDLTEDAAFLRILLSDTWRWRQRLVETFSFGATDHVRVSSSYQCELPPDLVAEFLKPHEAEDGFRKLLPRRFRGGGCERVKALIPVTTRPKEPVLALDLAGPDRSEAHLLTRQDISELLAGYLTEVISTSSIVSELRGLTDDLLFAIAVFSPGYFNRLQKRNGGYEAALREYLQDGLGFTPAASELKLWIAQCEEAGEALSEALEEPHDPGSSSEMLLLALPLLAQPPSSQEGVSRRLDGYCESVLAARDAKDLAVLQPLAEYGRRWEMIAEVEVPLGEPWLVRCTEDRPLHWEGHRSIQRLALGDAPSVHFQARTTDPSVSIAPAEKEQRVLTLSGSEVSPALLESVRETSDALALYASQEDRSPYYVNWEISFNRPWHVLLASYLIIGLLGSGLIGAVVVDADNLAEKLALLAVPTTFASAILLVREETGLAAKLEARRRPILAITTAALWITVLARLICSGTVI